MRTAIIGAALLIVGGVAVLSGVLPAGDARDVGERVWPVLLFVVSITVVTEIAAEAGLFTAIAGRIAGFGWGRAWILWVLVVVLATVSTVFLSLDTTAGLFASGLFITIEALHSIGLDGALAVVAGRGEAPLDLLRLAGTGLLGANLVDNLLAVLLDTLVDNVHMHGRGYRDAGTGEQIR